MSTVTLDFTGLPDQTPYNPPTDWISVGQNAAAIFSGALTGAAGNNTIWIYNKGQTGLLTSEVTFGTINSSESRGISFCNASGDGYIMLIRSVDARLFTCAAGVLVAQVGSTYSGTFAINDVVKGTLDTATGGFVFYKNNTQFATFTDTTYSAGLRAGLLIRSVTGYIKAISVSDYVLQAVTSINGGSPITASQTTVASVTTGFTGLPTAITSNLAGITCSAIGGTTNAPTFVKSQRVHGSPWPLNNTSATFTYVNGAESAAGAQQIVKDATEVVLTFAGAIINNPTALTYHLAADGFTPEGGELVYTPYGDLVLTADGGGTATNAGTFTSWFRPATGTGAGNVYSYTWNISEAGISPDNNNLTSVGLTSAGLTHAGLTSIGL